MITVGMQYEVRPGKEAEFEAGFKAVEEALQAEWKGHRLTRLFRDVFRPPSYMIYSEWETFEDFRRFIGSEAFQKATQWGREEILSARPRHTILKHEGELGGPPPRAVPGSAAEEPS